MTVIDFRLRPPTEEFKASHRALDSILGGHAPDKYYQSSLDECLKEMEEADVIGVLMGRQAPATLAISNDHIKQLASKYPKRFVPVGGIDPTQPKKCQTEIIELAKGCFKGVHFDHGLLDPPLYPDDRRLYPVYDMCEDLGLVVFLQIGPYAGPDVSYTSPIPGRKSRQRFPCLTNSDDTRLLAFY